MAFQIIDSHIHLYAASHLANLNWTADLPQDHPLNRQNSVADYRKATASPPYLRGFIFLETDRKSGLRENEWNNALDEVSFLARIAEGSPLQGDGHTAKDKELILGIVAWAPIPAGPGALATYLDKVYACCGGKASFSKIKGVRYLLQDKPAGTMLTPEFIGSLKLLGGNGLTFDLGVDARSGGLHQLEEACQMLSRVYADGSDLNVVINHLCKPNLRLSAEEAHNGNQGFLQWKSCIEKMASHGHTWMKLSGLFSELPSQDEETPASIDELVSRTQPWISTIFQCFGPSRILFGSDWPVCNVGGPGITMSWSHYVAFVTAILDSQNLTPTEKSLIWSGNAATVYNITTT